MIHSKEETYYEERGGGAQREKEGERERKIEKVKD